MKNCSSAILFQEGCVLQRRKPITVWGSGKDGMAVHVELGENHADSVVQNGLWECVLKPMEAARGLTLRIVCGDEEEIIQNVSVGEVWVAGGQSNMAFSLRYDADWEETKKLSPNSDIHMFNVPRLAYPGQEKDISDSGYWFQERDSAWEFFSAPAYAFARKLWPQIKVPIGIIGCNWGGASASVWVDRRYLEKEPLNVYLQEYESAVSGKDPEELKRLEEISFRAEETEERKKAMDEVLYGCSLKDQEEWMKKPAASLPPSPMGPYNVGRPGGLYHMMLKKICPYSVQGVLWYHGESDAAHDGIYDQLLQAVIRCFRDSFRQELPFLIVQLAPFGRWLWCRGDKFPQIRRCQELVSKTVPGVYLTSIMDLGMYGDLHPKRKMEIGRRLALLAMGKIYEKDILCECPAFRNARRTPEGIEILFEHTGSGLWEAPCEPEKEDEALKPSALTGPTDMRLGFVVSSREKTLSIRHIELLGDKILLGVDPLPTEECQVSFAEVPYMKVRIYNSAGLPVKPFRCRV